MASSISVALRATANDAKGNVTRYEYDLIERQVTLTDAMGRIMKFAYDNASRPLQTPNPEIRKPAVPTEVAPLLTQTWTPDGKRAGPAAPSTSATTRSTGWPPRRRPRGPVVTYGTTYIYDALNRSTKAAWDPAPTVTAPAAGPLVSFGASARLSTTIPGSLIRRERPAPPATWPTS